MTLKMLWQEYSARFREAGVPEPETDAWYLLEHVTGVTRARYFMNPDQSVPDEQLIQYTHLCERRMQRIPLQHLTGVQEFMGYEFIVSDAVLIPRQDTEILVEEAAGILRKDSDILDVCTGSGCILLSLLKIAEERGLGSITGVGVDISEDALAVAGKNKEKLSIKNAELLRGDLLEPVADRRFDIIVSNPPYIRTEEIEKLEAEVKVFDPFIALDGGADGLIFYRRIVEQAAGCLKKGGSLLFEIGYDQGEDVKRLMEQAGFENVRIKKDFAGLDRVVFGVYNR